MLKIHPLQATLLTLYLTIKRHFTIKQARKNEVGQAKRSLLALSFGTGLRDCQRICLIKTATEEEVDTVVLIITASFIASHLFKPRRLICWGLR